MGRFYQEGTKQRAACLADTALAVLLSGLHDRRIEAGIARYLFGQRDSDDRYPRALRASLPRALLAVTGTIAASAFLRFRHFGIDTIGSVPGGLPHFRLPEAPWSTAPSLLATAASCTIVIIAQSAATSRSYAPRSNDAFSENRDLIGLAAANIGATVSGTFVVNGSPTKTEMVDMAGGRSQIAQLTSAVIVLLVLLSSPVPLASCPPSFCRRWCSSSVSS
jgi:MFS superfamily sulfate permease-like transporter